MSLYQYPNTFIKIIWKYMYFILFLTLSHTVYNYYNELILKHVINL